MNLLPKKTIESQKQKERKIEIDEGIKLATSIDEMRRLRADEETNLTQYRNNALRSIQSEIDAYLAEREGYRLEVIELQKQRILLLAPIEDEWREVNEARADLIESQALLEQEKYKIEQDKKIVLMNLEVIKNTDKKSKERERLSIEAFAQAQLIKENADNEAKMIANEHDIQNQEYGRRLEELKQLEESYKNGININAIEIKQIKEKEDELIIREQDLQRRINNLQRTQGVT